MTKRIKDIDDLFSMFHDVEIVGLKLNRGLLIMQIRLPWGELWNIEDYKLTIQFDGCTNLKCHYFKRKSSELKKGGKEVDSSSEEYTTTDPDEIVKLKLDVQSHDFKNPDCFILNCNSSTSLEDQIGKIDFAKIELTVKDFHIFDNKKNEMTLDKMKNLATEWWDGIQKMWAEQKRKK